MRTVRYLATALVLGIWLLPALWCLYVSLTPRDVFLRGGNGLPGLSVESYERVLGVDRNPESNYRYSPVDGFLMSVAVSCTVAALVAALVSPLATVVALAVRLDAGIGSAIRIAGLFALPVVAVAHLWLRALSAVGLNDTLIGMTAVQLAVGAPLALGVAIALRPAITASRAFTIARLDGLVRFPLLRAIATPQVRAALVLVAGASFVSAYHEFFATYVVTQFEIRPVSVVIAGFQTLRATEWGLAAAAGVLASIPVVAVLSLVLWTGRSEKEPIGY